MSPTCDQLTGDSSSSRRSTSKTGANPPDGGHLTFKAPSFKPITPCTEDSCLSCNTDNSGRTKSAIQSNAYHEKASTSTPSVDVSMSHVTRNVTAHTYQDITQKKRRVERSCIY